MARRLGTAVSKQGISELLGAFSDPAHYVRIDLLGDYVADHPEVVASTKRLFPAFLGQGLENTIEPLRELDKLIPLKN